eukprot:4266409-Amphidinium_carterae.1
MVLLSSGCLGSSLEFLNLSSEHANMLQPEQITYLATGNVDREGKPEAHKTYWIRTVGKLHQDGSTWNR